MIQREYLLDGSFVPNRAGSHEASSGEGGRVRGASQCQVMDPSSAQSEVMQPFVCCPVHLTGIDVRTRDACTGGGKILRGAGHLLTNGIPILLAQGKREKSEEQSNECMTS